jgi:hypothetical protein
MKYEDNENNRNNRKNMKKMYNNIKRTEQTPLPQPLPTGEGSGLQQYKPGDNSCESVPLSCGEGLGERSLRGGLSQYKLFLSPYNDSCESVPLSCGKGLGERSLRGGLSQYKPSSLTSNDHCESVPLPCGEGLGERSLRNTISEKNHPAASGAHPKEGNPKQYREYSITEDIRHSPRMKRNLNRYREYSITEHVRHSSPLVERSKSGVVSPLMIYVPLPCGEGLGERSLDGSSWTNLTENILLIK